MTRTMVVTCGATVPFPSLVQAVLDLDFLTTIRERWNFKKVVIQYGRGFGGEFEKRVKALGSASAHGKEAIGKASRDLGVELEVHGRVAAVEICGFAFTTDIEGLLRVHADLVISHAGTGSILDALRLHKRLVVVANTGLMDNHQLQITDRLRSRGHLVAAHDATSVAVLEAVVSAMEADSTTPLATGTSEAFTNLLLNVANS
ncbi:N-acetylglucosaminyldiphosphodolichol N-acetylglucosaminyltransferase catalytic subunit ALG13 LALA0_S08e06458g [Lachancea lanzarotensis]|uniref:UDP-N-acetylglucosamine transferase subunit ALG13 n=1 Tax=Lachancea lanzarotensis TaxID=1245769 RepID=A0A0C7N6U2_9SACH|nr:uncharacterized protein LALA0_S08e06458g [Lachancea lanzarotensis]CEP63607.1 LALA0S08e06458g1_1 [Lachancea lanzarotensis]